MQPLGFENHVLPDNKITSSQITSSGANISSVRLNSQQIWCSNFGNLKLDIDFGRIITFTGFAVQGNVNTLNNLYMMYRVDPTKPEINELQTDGKYGDRRVIISFSLILKLSIIRLFGFRCSYLLIFVFWKLTYI